MHYYSKINLNFLFSKTIIRSLLFSLSLFSVISCGGGGGSDKEVTTKTTADSGTSSDNINTDNNPLVTLKKNKIIYGGDNVILSANDVNFSGIDVNQIGNEFLWRQVSGPPVEIETPNAMITSISTPNEESNLSFSLKVKDQQGNENIGSIEVPVKFKNWKGCSDNTTPENTQSLDGEWRKIDLFTGTWTIYWEDDNGSIEESGTNITFCKNGVVLTQEDGGPISDNLKWIIDDFGGIQYTSNLDGYDPNAYDNRLNANVLYQPSNTKFRLCGDEQEGYFVGNGQYFNCSDEDVWSSYRQVSSLPLSSKAFAPEYLNGTWQRVHDKRIVECDLNRGDCVLLNESLNVEGIIGLPDTQGSQKFINLLSNNDNSISNNSSWFQYSTDTLRFIKWLWPDNSIVLDSENSFISVTDNSPGSVLDGLVLAGSASLVSKYVRINGDNIFQIEKSWNNDNKSFPSIFVVNDEGLYNFTHISTAELFLVNITNSTIITQFEKGHSEEDIHLNQGQHILVPDLSNAFTPFVTQTTIAPDNSINKVGSITNSNLLPGELKSCTTIAWNECTLGNQCLELCKIPTLEGKWRKSDGRIIECLSGLGPCVYKAYGASISTVNNLPNILEQAMLKNISFSSKDYYSSEARVIQYEGFNKEFKEFTWKDTYIELLDFDTLKTNSGTYTKIN